MSVANSKQPGVQRHQELCLILELSNAMLEASLAGDWDALIEHEAKRRPCMEAYFQTGVTGHEVMDVVEAVRRIIEIDQQIVALSTVRQDFIAAELRNFNLVKTAVDAYSQNAG